MLLALKLLGHWLTLETGKVGDTNEPKAEEEEEPEEEKVPGVKKALGFTVLDPYRDE